MPSIHMTHTKRNRNSSGDSGFTLLEVLMAMLITSVGVFSLISLQMTSIESNAHSRRVSELSNHALARVEELLAIDYDDLQTGEISEDEYTIKWDVYANVPIVDAKTVVVTVSHVRERDKRYYYMKYDKI
ncbi:MAG: prepilin-type N-terminal cleavage/methylation domain-containing protein [Desulfobacterales bacterium]|nr:prepilin-type N-terminal cleavage/methylation domain-containing protein [Desulfobacterales bacterium]